MFFSEPKHEWCYYFTKAELAQQMGDYQKVISLGNEAASLGYRPTDQNEWLVFIKAHALTGDIQTAMSISTAALKEDARVRRGICVAWQQVWDKGPAEKKNELEQILLTFKCNPR
jgi:tetratricopeptide (TPR) repeat protein